MRSPSRIHTMLLVALGLCALPATASAQASYKNSGGASTSKAGATSYDEQAGYDSGGASIDQTWSEDTDADNGGQAPNGSLPNAPKTPVAPVAPIAPTTPSVTTSGTVAQMMSNGKATVPRGAPKSVRSMIVAANRLIGKPYKWGGGHAKVEDSGYDCSGSVSYALMAGGTLTSPLVSGTLAKWGANGRGRWVTIYANKGHVYMEIAGLRFDTSPIGDPSIAQGPRWRPLIGARKGFKVRHPSGL